MAETVAAASSRGSQRIEINQLLRNFPAARRDQPCSLKKKFAAVNKADA
jgi:hypothetical protein